MSVLIKDMTFPENCAHCPYRKMVDNQNNLFSIGAVCCVRGRGRNEKTIYRCNNKVDMEYALRGDRPDWCPLVGIKTPHGDLIDRDELIEDIANQVPYIIDDSDTQSYTNGLAVAKLSVDIAPVVIEAEGAEE